MNSCLVSAAEEACGNSDISRLPCCPLRHFVRHWVYFVINYIIVVLSWYMLFYVSIFSWNRSVDCWTTDLFALWSNWHVFSVLQRSVLDSEQIMHCWGFLLKAQRVPGEFCFLNHVEESDLKGNWVMCEISGVYTTKPPVWLTSAIMNYARFRMLLWRAPTFVGS